MANLFAKKAPVAEKPAKKDDKISVVVPGADFSKKLKTFKEKKAQMNNLKAEIADIQGEILAVGKEEWIKLYQKMQRNPESFRLKDEGNEAILIMPKDQCLSIGDERAKELQEKYGESIVNEETTFAFNSDLLNKYGEQLSNLIQSADFMTDEEKEALVVPSTTVAIKKGAVNEAFTTGEGKVEEYLADIQPIVAIK
jgi:hypothetical protein